MIWEKHNLEKYRWRPEQVDCEMCRGLQSEDNCKYCADTGLCAIPLAEVIGGIRRGELRSDPAWEAKMAEWSRE